MEKWWTQTYLFTVGVFLNSWQTGSSGNKGTAASVVFD